MECFISVIPGRERRTDFCVPLIRGLDPDGYSIASSAQQQRTSFRCTGQLDPETGGEPAEQDCSWVFFHAFSTFRTVSSIALQSRAKSIRIMITIMSPDTT